MGCGSGGISLEPRCSPAEDMMEESKLWRTLRYYAVKGFVDAFWIAMIFHPLYVWYLWRFWLLRPIIIWFSVYTVFLIYNLLHFPTTAIFCWLTNGGKHSVFKPLFMKFQLSAAYLFLKALHGMEVHGLHNLPKGGGLVVYYHAPFVPIDLAYLFSYVYLKFGRMIGGSVDRNWHGNWFFRPLVELYEFSSDRRKFIEDLQNGQLRSVAPGGAYEAMFSKDYSLEWRSRIGFAKIAKETGVPVVPMFTTNLQHSMPLAAFNRSDTMKEWYALIKRPVCMPLCYLPVKMRIHLGEPLTCGKDEEPEEFAQRVKKAVENLRDRHQPPHKTSFDALRERLW